MYAKPLKFGLYCKLTVLSIWTHKSFIVPCCYCAAGWGLCRARAPTAATRPGSPGPRHPFRFYCCSTESLLVIPTLQKLPRSP